MSEYQPFLISTQKTGLFTYLQPWIRPNDAYEPLENAQIYRGVLTKRNGYTQVGAQLDDTKPVMGIMRYENENTGKENLVVGTTKNLYLYSDGGNSFSKITSIANSVFWQGPVAMGASTIPLSGSTSTFFPNLTASTVIVKAYYASAPTVVIDQVTDDGAGGWGSPTTSVLFTGTGAINYVTGAVNFGTDLGAAANVFLSVTATTTGNYFTGTIRNFMNWTNWGPTDPVTFTDTQSYLFIANDVDPITLFDGTNLSRPILYWDDPYAAKYSSGPDTNYITTALDVKVYQNRLLLILPTVKNSSNSLNQTIFWSQQYNPFNFNNVITGNGGALSAATSDIIQSFNFLRDICVIRMNRSVWVFRFTGNDFNPFFFQKINATKSTNCPYASLEFDERETGIGNTGMTACDGVNVQRFDIPIIDFYETNMNETYYAQAFSLRNDNTSEAWTLFCSQSNSNPLVGGTAPGSDQALIYNFVENTWATYVWTIPVTCLGTYHVVNGLTWADATFTWASADRPWFSYSTQSSAPNILMGDTTGNVWWVDQQGVNDDAGTPITATIRSTRWNPFLGNGEKVQFGYIDMYYERNDDCDLGIEFFVDNSNNPCAQRTISLAANGTDGTAGSNSAMKRIYINAMGEFIQMQILSSSAAEFNIYGFILWCRPAGRITP